LEHSLNLKQNTFLLTLAVIIFFPRGVGLSLFGFVLDLNEIIHLILVVFILSKIKIDIQKDGLLVLLLISPIFLVFLTPFPQEAFINYLLNFILYILAYFIGKFFITNYADISSSVNLIKMVALINTFCLLIALSNHFFQIVNFDIFRVYEEDILDTTKNLQRMIDNYIGYAAFRGGLMASNHFAFSQLSILSFLISWFYCNHKQLSKKLLILFSFSILLSAFTIILSQSRGAILLMVALFLLVNFISIHKDKKIWFSFYNPSILLIILLAICIIYFFEQVEFFIANVSTLINYLGMSGYGGVEIQSADSSKRVAAFLFLDNINNLYPLAFFTGLGFGFWKYFPENEINYFADMPLLISMTLEYGIIIMFVIFLLIMSRLIRLVFSNFFYSYIPYIFSFSFLILSLQISSAKDLYWLLFFLLGIVYNIRTKLINK